MKPFSIYFPQFHSIPHNDKTWGYGFTDWVLVAYANMHNLWARRSPAIGFYDGSSEDVHLFQISQMKINEIGGIALYHYWFYEGERVLDSFEKTLLNNNKEKILPWFFIWATESWSKRWLGDATEIINLPNSPSDFQIDEHCRYLTECFSNEMYLKIDGRPLFVFFNLSHFKNPQKVISTYKKYFNKYGFNPLMGQFIKNPFDINYSHHIDINYLFEPRLFFGFNNKLRSNMSKKIFDIIRGLIGESTSQKLLLISDKLKKTKKTYSSSDFVKYMRSNERKQFKNSFKTPVCEVLSPGWNNVPRHGERFTAIQDIEENDFKSILKCSLQSNSKYPTLINAWNEWSEGAAIEPCHYMGTKYLDVVKNINE